jgi:hypothetical protein
VDVSHGADPGENLFGILLCAFNRMDLGVLAAAVVLVIVD